MLSLQPVVVDEGLSDSQELPVLGGLRVLETPGHTPGHLSFLVPAAGILFCGDSIIARGGGLQVSRGVNTWDETQALDSARKQVVLGANIIRPGHGVVVRGATGIIPQVQRWLPDGCPQWGGGGCHSPHLPPFCIPTRHPLQLYASEGEWRDSPQRCFSDAIPGQAEPHSGMFPCFLGGFVSRLLRSISSALMRRGRVSRGSITSST